MAEILGYTTQEMLGKDLISFLEDQAIPTALATLKRRRLGFKEHREAEMRQQNGKCVLLGLETAPIIINGLYAGAIAAVRGHHVPARN